MSAVTIEAKAAEPIIIDIPTWEVGRILGRLPKHNQALLELMLTSVDPNSVRACRVSGDYEIFDPERPGRLKYPVLVNHPGNLYVYGTALRHPQRTGYEAAIFSLNEGIPIPHIPHIFGDLILTQGNLDIFGVRQNESLPQDWRGRFRFVRSDPNFIAVDTEPDVPYLRKFWRTYASIAVYEPVREDQRADMVEPDINRLWVRDLCDKFDQLERTFSIPSRKSPAVDWYPNPAVVKY